VDKIKMNVVDYKVEAKKVLDTLPDGKIRVALHLLEYLKSLDTREEPRASALHDWIECFTDREKEELLQELLESIESASSSGDWSQVQEIIESWEETADILSDERLMAEIKEAEEEIRRGETVSWEEAKRRLNLR
jgi:coenzyme F420-reducing hydrogenase alpha subunit